MKIIAYTLLTLTTVCITSAAYAEDVSVAFAKCAVTKDDHARLACYDKIRDDAIKTYTPTSTINGYQPISLPDLKVDIKTLLGKKVAFDALIQSMGEVYMLKSNITDMTAIFADVEKLPRDDRKKLLNSCQTMLCKGRFYGAVKQLPIGIGISVDKVEWQ